MNPQLTGGWVLRVGSIKEGYNIIVEDIAFRTVEV